MNTTPKLNNRNKYEFDQMKGDNIQTAQEPLQVRKKEKGDADQQKHPGSVLAAHGLDSRIEYWQVVYLVDCQNQTHGSFFIFQGH